MNPAIPRDCITTSSPVPIVEGLQVAMEGTDVSTLAGLPACDNFGNIAIVGRDGKLGPVGRYLPESTESQPITGSTESQPSPVLTESVESQPESPPPSLADYATGVGVLGVFLLTATAVIAYAWQRSYRIIPDDTFTPRLLPPVPTRFRTVDVPATPPHTPETLARTESARALSEKVRDLKVHAHLIDESLAMTEVQPSSTPSDVEEKVHLSEVHAHLSPAPLAMTEVQPSSTPPDIEEKVHKSAHAPDDSARAPEEKVHDRDLSPFAYLEALDGSEDWEITTAVYDDLPDCIDMDIEELDPEDDSALVGYMAEFTRKRGERVEDVVYYLFGLTKRGGRSRSARQYSKAAAWVREVKEAGRHLPF